MTAQPGILVAKDIRVEADGHALLAGIDLQLRAGQVLGIIGPNGAGKSTLLKVLAGVHAPHGGAILLDAKPLQTFDDNQRARMLAYLEQRPHVHWPLEVSQVVALGRLPFGETRSPDAQKAIETALTRTSAGELRARTFHTLSEGEKMRVHLARILAGTPRIILADEPVAALDPWHQLQVLELLRSEAQRGTAIALVLHDLQLAARYCDQLLVLDRGASCASGPPREVLDSNLLARVWRIAASIDSATLAVTIDRRL